MLTDTGVKRADMDGAQPCTVRLKSFPLVGNFRFHWKSKHKPRATQTPAWSPAKSKSDLRALSLEHLCHPFHAHVSAFQLSQTALTVIPCAPECPFRVTSASLSGCPKQPCPLVVVETLTLEQCARDPSASTTSNDSHTCCMRPYLCEDVSIPTPMTSPPETNQSINHHGRNGFSTYKKGFCSITQLLSQPKVLKSHCAISQEPLL